MADVQKYFKQFHDEIKLGYDDNYVLREKRDTVLRELKSGLRRMFGATAPKFTYFNQGSYTLGTGVYPLDSDFDIDVGIVFELDRNDFAPTRVKEWVFDALNTRNRTVNFKYPCISVQYHQAGELAFHVDLAVYTKETNAYFGQTPFYIAKGKYGSKNEYKMWEISEPFELLNLLKKRFDDADDNAQLRRVIRYLKRWSELNFYDEGHAKPRGIAITALAYNLFVPEKSYDWKSQKYCYDDLKATRNFVSSILGSFDWLGKIAVELPVKPHNNLFVKMTSNQMSDFASRLSSLKECLESAIGEKDTEEACYELWQEFGDDFPTPGYED